MSYYYQVIPFGQIQESLTYKFSKIIPVGSIVQIPLRRKTQGGVVLSQTTVRQIKFDLKKILPIKSFYSHPLSKETIEFYQYLSVHYFIDLGMVYKMALQQYPTSDIKNYFSFSNKIYRSQKNLMESCKLTAKQWRELTSNQSIIPTDQSFLFEKTAKSINLNEEQEKIFQNIWKKNNNFITHLIDGVTGSGKTELYLKLIEENLKAGYQSLVLLPEIALTEEWSKRFQLYFGCEPFIWHSKQTKQQKSRILRSLLSGEPCVIVGARSAVLLPFHTLKLVVCDEEHDSSYKQEEGPRYHAKDMAIFKAKCNNAICTLVSASPSLESLYNLNNHKIISHQLANQFHQTELPEIAVVDMNALKPGPRSWISKTIYDETIKVLKTRSGFIFSKSSRICPYENLCKLPCNNPMSKLCS